MKILASVLVAMLILLPALEVKVYSQNAIEYTVRIGSNRFAEWTVVQTFRVNDTYDDLDQLQNRLISVAEAERNVTARAMSMDAISMSATVSGTYVTVEYKFNWENFSETGDPRIEFGDVFQVENLFSQLYGDGKIQIIYPSEHQVERVSPPPSMRDDSVQLLEWPGTADFEAGNVVIVLNANSGSPGLFDPIAQNALLVGGLVIVGAVFSISILVVRRRKKKREAKSSEKTPSPTPLGVESDEERVVKMLEAAGGSAYQSAITDHFNFSRAKTSQLLGIMEGKVTIRRYQRGRDKIVVLIEKEESGKR